MSSTVDATKDGCCQAGRLGGFPQASSLDYTDGLAHKVSDRPLIALPR